MHSIKVWMGPLADTLKEILWIFRRQKREPRRRLATLIKAEELQILRNL